MGARGPFRDLTPRQQQIAEGIARGLTYAEIGAALSMSRHTVASHVRQIAVLFDSDGDFGCALAPRQVIFAWMMAERVERERNGRR